MKRLSILVVTLLILASFLTGCEEESTTGDNVSDSAAPAVDTTPTAEELASSGNPALVTDIAGQTRQSGEFTLSDHRGTTVVVNFFATWCGPCRQEIPSLAKLNREFGDELVLVGVSVDDDASALDEFITAQGIDYPVLFLEELENKNAIMNDYVFSAIPTTFVVRPDGTPGEMIVGSRDESTFRSIFEKYLPEGA